MAIIKRLIQRIQDDGTEAAPSSVIDAEASIDDGSGYGSPLDDTRPDFVKEANAGWRTLGYLEKRP